MQFCSDMRLIPGRVIRWLKHILLNENPIGGIFGTKHGNKCTVWGVVKKFSKLFTNSTLIVRHHERVPSWTKSLTKPFKQRHYEFYEYNLVRASALVGVSALASWWIFYLMGSMIHLSHKKGGIRYYIWRMQNLHANNDEKQVIFNRGIAREYFAGTGIQTHDLLTHVFFITGFSFSSSVSNTVRPLLVASALGVLVAAAIATVSVTCKQTQSLYIQ